MWKLLNSGSDLAYGNICMEQAGEESGAGAGEGEGEGEGAAEAAAEATAAAGEKGAAEGHWTEGMDEETTTYLAGKGIDKMTQPEALNTLLKSYRGLEAKMGAGNDKLIMRPDMDDPEQVEKFYQELGRPEKAEEYKAPEGEIDPAFFGNMQQAAHKAGLTPSQMEILGAAYQDNMGQSAEAFQNEVTLQQETETADLKKEWGSDFDRRIGEIARFGKESGLPDEAVQALEDGFGTKTMLTYLYGLAEKTGSGSTVNTQTDSHATPKEAAGKMNSLMSEISVDPSRLAAYNKGKGADYEKMQKYISLASPSG